MPVHKVRGGFKYGNTGKVYKRKEDALKQERAINISRHQRKKNKK